MMERGDPPFMGTHDRGELGQRAGRTPVEGSVYITRLLHDVQQGRRQAENDLVEAIYPQLHKIALNCLRGERPNHSLQATALVNEAYIQLVGQLDKDWENRAHFFAVAAQLMRRILVDYARARNAKKRGGGKVKVELQDSMIVSEDRLDEVIAVDAALEKLAKIDERQCRIVVMHYFGGMSDEEIAGLLEISPRTVSRELSFAKAWLRGELSDGAASAASNS
jgi:RNA polymerase sigma factor (TIGR02999 family)